jgi:acetyltransferase-like isoleucine patch superfamily enzyme
MYTLFNIALDYLYKRKKRKIWRKKNLHNFTFLVTVPNTDNFFSRVHVGNKTYGPINAIFSNAENESLKIGNYCSIGSGTTFLLGSEHYYKGISTFPFKVKILGEKAEALSKGPIVVEDDVWFGENVLVLSGLKIGKGAIIAAASVVVKDVPPYAIVGGNPAKIIKYRFSENVLNKIKSFDFSRLNDSSIAKNINLFYTELNDENVDQIIEDISRMN